jgi:hypothetical protein
VKNRFDEGLIERTFHVRTLPNDMSNLTTVPADIELACDVAIRFRISLRRVEVGFWKFLTLCPKAHNLRSVFASEYWFILAF